MTGCLLLFDTDPSLTYDEMGKGEVAVFFGPTPLMSCVCVRLKIHRVVAYVAASEVFSSLQRTRRCYVDLQPDHFDELC